MRIVIRAGGIGTRLWPWSRSARPKQFLPLTEGRSPVQVAYDRFRQSGLAGPDEIYVSVGKDSLDLALSQLPDVERDQFIVEPVLRDTAAAVGLETVYVTARGGEGIIASLGSDHYVGRPEVFTRALGAAETFLKKHPGYLVAIACEPTRVETNYGHIRKGEVLEECDGLPVHLVTEFVEKPEYRLAESYTASGDYLWNANFFVWTSETLLKRFRRLEPEMHEDLMELREALQRGDFREALRVVYSRIKKVAIDYAVLEPTAREGQMAVIPVAMEWSDIGSWATLTDAYPPDEDGNLFLGPVLADETFDTTVVVRNPERRIVATIGVEGLAVVDTGDALLICPKDQCAKVKRLVERMKKSEQWRDLV
ncbi:MAG: mannose-1-phosphate guanylyltransferase [Candidatus Brocadiaceae bacterium]|nr:mannose-1-phosphate guanylyltransferase [Candidatus Brocadiaceae bacterium]